MKYFVNVDMSELKIRFEEVPEKYRKMGGRWLTSQFVYDEVPPICHPLGPFNKLIFAPGIVTGTTAPCSGRISVGGKSPLTGGIKEANAGTPAAQALAKMGIKAIVIQGQPKEQNGCWILRINGGSGSLEPAEEFIGMGIYEFAERIKKKYGKVDFAVIGPAGEKCMPAAGVCFNDKDGRPYRYAARGGLGAVMGAKGLKAIIIEDDCNNSSVTVVKQGNFKDGRRKLVEALREHRMTKPGGLLNTYGMSFLMDVLNRIGALPTRNFRAGSFEGAHKLSGEVIIEMIKQRKGEGTIGYPCHPGCIIQCGHIWPRPDGVEHVDLKYESVWALGANCGIDDIDAIAELIWICNNYGLDTIEVGVTLGVAMEAGLLPFGGHREAKRLVMECAQGKLSGRFLGSGAATAGRLLGVRRVPVVKGQGMPGYDPRIVKGLGITYMTSPMGSDHTAGYTAAAEIFGIGGRVNPLASTGKTELSRYFQSITAFLDAAGFCLFILFAVLDIDDGFRGVVETCNGVLGTEWTADDVMLMGAEILRIERSFNEAAGFTKADDRPPEFMRYEPLPPHSQVYDVAAEELDGVFHNETR